MFSGFNFDDTKQEAADSIKSVNALYGYTPKFLEIYAQAGAAYASLRNNIIYNNSVVNKHILEENTEQETESSHTQEDNGISDDLTDDERTNSQETETSEAHEKIASQDGIVFGETKTGPFVLITQNIQKTSYLLCV